MKKIGSTILLTPTLQELKELNSINTFSGPAPNSNISNFHLVKELLIFQFDLETFFSITVHWTQYSQNIIFGVLGNTSFLMVFTIPKSSQFKYSKRHDSGMFTLWNVGVEKWYTFMITNRIHCLTTWQPVFWVCTPMRLDN